MISTYERQINNTGKQEVTLISPVTVIRPPLSQQVSFYNDIVGQMADQKYCSGD